MPQSTQELRDRWGLSPKKAVEHLESKGFVLGADNPWEWTFPVGYEPTKEDRDAMIYLIEEWDFGGFRRQDDGSTGFTAPPSHYDGEREVIDVIRDLMDDDCFAAWCMGNAIKYRMRAGKKGDARQDRAKATFYELMARHVWAGGADPRSDRPSFVPYEPWTVDIKAPTWTYPDERVEYAFTSREFVDGDGISLGRSYCVIRVEPKDG